MKITGIDIGEYRQFKNIKFDFTYPEGHPKAGQPLDKVCFIGQSGTGKTTLLNVIWGLLGYFGDLNWPTDEGAIEFGPSEEKELLIGNLDYHIVYGAESAIIKSHIIDDGDYDIVAPYLVECFKGKLFDLSSINKFCLFIQDSVIRESDAFLLDQNSQPNNFKDFVKTPSQVEKEKKDHEDILRSVGENKSVLIGDSATLSVWKYLLRDINDYEESSRALIVNLVQSVQGPSPDKVIAELQSWIAKTPNPRIDLAERCLNPILTKLFLELDIKGGNAPINLRTTKGINIPEHKISTGTRQLLATAIPIYKFDTNGTVILFDEPERSLFPDIQRELVKYYTGLAPEAQFFFATHSPIIAAAFEPCERFILYFDENGEVKFHNGIAPEGDDPNDVLRQDFGMEYLMLQKGLEKYDEYRQLGMQIRQETDEQEKNRLIAKRVALGNLYNF